MKATERQLTTEFREYAARLVLQERLKVLEAARRLNNKVLAVSTFFPAANCFASTVKRLAVTT